MPTPEESKREQIDPHLQQDRWIIQNFRQLDLTLSSLADHLEELEAMCPPDLQRATRRRQSILQNVFTGEIV
jgi:hypothetical protein